MSTKIKTGPSRRRGFTLIEMMIVVVIIGVLASLAIPAIAKTRRKALASRMADDFREFGNKFHIHGMTAGEWPADNTPRGIPSGMESALMGGPWTQQTALGGYWDFDGGVFGVTAAISVDGFTADLATLAAIDEHIDDGNLNTGSLRLVRSDHFAFILED